MDLIKHFTSKINTTIGGTIQVKAEDRMTAILRSDGLWELSLKGIALHWAVTDERLAELMGTKKDDKA